MRTRWAGIWFLKKVCTCVLIKSSLRPWVQAKVDHCPASLRWLYCFSASLKFPSWKNFRPRSGAANRSQTGGRCPLRRLPIDIGLRMWFSFGQRLRIAPQPVLCACQPVCCGGGGWLAAALLGLLLMVPHGAEHGGDPLLQC